MTRSEFLSSGKRANPTTVTELRELLGQDVVLLPIPYGQKWPIQLGWQRLTTAKMDDPKHLAALEGGNIGVLLGTASNGLVTFDFDDGDYAVKFLELNGVLSAGPVTKGARGCNVWVRLVGEIPESFNIKTKDGKAIGEFRADRRQTVVYGKHPSGNAYSQIGKFNSPITTTFEEIVWPEGIILPGRENSDDPDNDRYAKLIAKHGEPVLIGGKGSVTINEPFFAAKFLTEHPVLFQPGVGFYEYEQTTGLWQRITDCRVKKMFSDDLFEYGKKADLESLAYKRTDSRLRSLIEIFRGHAETDMQKSKDRDLIHFANGMLHLTDDVGELKPFAPEYYSTNATPFPYIADATCPRCRAWLNDEVGPEDSQMYFDCLGMALTGDNFAQKILLLTGVGGSGKGVLMTIAQAVVGKANCAGLRTSQLNGRFELARFVDKTLLIGSDVPGDFLNLAGAQMLKSLTGGDLLAVESKNSNNSHNIVGNFNVFITSNQRLRLRLDGDHLAWKRRLLVIDFQKPVKHVNPLLAEQIIQDEASGIINAALAGLRRVRTSFQENGQFPMTQAQGRRVIDLLDESDSLRSFLRGAVEPKIGQDVTSDELQRAYAHYCSDHGWIEQPAVVFNKLVPQLMLEFFKASYRHDIIRGGYAKRGYSGLAMKGKTCL